jgi:hypothetical protein
VQAFIAEAGRNNGLDLFAFAENGRWKREDGWVSHCYSQREPSRVYVYSAPVSGDSNVVSFLLPWRDASSYHVAEVEAVGGRAFEVTNDKWLDIVMIRTQERVETARLSSDFAWTWARFSRNDEETLVETLLLGGSNLALGGRQIFTASRRLEHVFANRIGEEFRIETNEGTLHSSFPVVTDRQSAI